MKNKLKIAILTAAIAAAALAFVQSRPLAQTQQVETAGKKFKNIKVLNDMPADQMGKVMNMMAASLGFKCSGCHVSNDKDFEKDDNEHKVVARKMLTMTFALNKQFFDGKTEVTCNTCHNGHERPVAVPNLSAVEHVTERPKQPTVKPTIEQILAAYAKGLGPAAVTSRVITATRVEPDGKTTEIENVVQAPGKIRVETRYPDYVVVEGSDGKATWKTGGGSAIELKSDEAEQIKREAQLFANADLAKVYTKLEYRFMDRIDGRDVYLVLGTLADNSRERLYFDVATGLLVRRIASTPTILGAFQYQVDYSDYKDFGGVKLPVSTRFAVPAITWTRKITDVKLNKPIDDSVFRIMAPTSKS